VSQYQIGKTNLDFTEARDSEWQWDQLDHQQNSSLTLLIKLSFGCKPKARNCVTTASFNMLEAAECFSGLWLWDVRRRTLLGNTSLIRTCRAERSSAEAMRDSKTEQSASINNDSSFVSASRDARKDNSVPGYATNSRIII